MRYKSTRGGEAGISFEEVIFAAYAKDGGLYVPEHLPMLSKATLLSWAKSPLSRIAAEVLHLFSGISVEECAKMTKTAFAKFNDGKEPSLPLHKVANTFVLETGKGPTFAFKDIGQQVIAQLFNYFLSRSKKRATIVVETSGDTGPAAVEAVRGCSNVSIFCLYPKGRVSPVQELQLTTVDAENVQIYQTEGNTDEQCEALKLLFKDKDFVEKHRICSINSINIGRIIAQSTYYIWAYLQVEPDLARDVNFVIPTGAFGNATGGMFARLMGLPIGTIVCATNENDAVHRAITEGVLSIGENKSTVSPAMDIQFAYNLERLLFYMCNQNPGVTKYYMEKLFGREKVVIDELILKRIQATFVSTCVSDEKTLGTISKYWKDYKYALCPHSAIGVYASELQSVKDLPGQTICVLTAHPVKFQETLKEAGVVEPIHIAAVEKLLQLKNDLYTVLPREGTRKATLQSWVDTLKQDIKAFNLSGRKGKGIAFGRLEDQDEKDRLGGIVGALLDKDPTNIFFRKEPMKDWVNRLAVEAAVEFNKGVGLPARAKPKVLVEPIEVVRLFFNPKA